MQLSCKELAIESLETKVVAIPCTPPDPIIHLGTFCFIQPLLLAFHSHAAGLSDPSSRREKADLLKCQSWLSDLARSNGVHVHEDIREALEETASLLSIKKSQQPPQQQQKTMTSSVVQPSFTQYSSQFQDDAKIGRLFTISCHQPSLFEMLRVSIRLSPLPHLRTTCFTQAPKPVPTH